MPEGVIDLTAEDEGDDLDQPTYAYTTIQHHQRQPARPIDLTDESDDIEYIGQNRIHLPARPHATGNDQRHPHFNRNVEIANPNALPGRRRGVCKASAMFGPNDEPGLSRLIGQPREASIDWFTSICSHPEQCRARG